MMRLRPSLLFAVLALACSRPAALPDGTVQVAAVAARDPSSYAEPDRVRVEHLSLDLEVDFASRTLAGSATLRVAWADGAPGTLVLDTRDLTIERVDGEGSPLSFQLDPRDPVFGQRLVIDAPEKPRTVRITYRTSPDASGLLWLAPSMTAGGKLPFLFSQSQAIHARSWVPIQDTPSVRFTYDAEVRTPPEVTALMSADNHPNAVRTGRYRFAMPQPIPSYLLALAVGDLTFRPLSERSGVWAEPSVVEGARDEFVDTERMIRSAEALYGPYRWERYDILVLPPSFPYGGMENPRLTFATPTVIVGDKSLVNLIAHELAHSWSGNLVTNASWKDGWLNEGFTSYVENRLVEALYGEEAAAMENVIAQADLARQLASEVPPEDQLLALPPFGTRDPDDVLGDVAYVKGQWFLIFLEKRFGRDAFDAFLRKWFDEHAFTSTDSDEFERFLARELVATYPGKVNPEEVRAFMHEPGIPEFAPRATSTRLTAVDAARTGWLEGTTPARELGWANLGTQERIYFLEGMPDRLARERIAELDAACALSGTPNGELAMRFYPLAERSGYDAARPAMAAFLKRVGRRKLILPIYDALVETDAGRAFAREVFAAARDGYHPIARASVEERLGADAGQ